MSVSTILRTVSGRPARRPAGRPARTLHDELDALESRLNTQLDRAVEANSVMRQFIEEHALMDEFVTWQTTATRDRSSA